MDASRHVCPKFVCTQLRECCVKRIERALNIFLYHNDPLQNVIDLSQCLNCEEGRKNAADLENQDLLDLLKKYRNLLSCGNCGNPLRMTKAISDTIDEFMETAGYSERRTMLHEMYVEMLFTTQEIARKIAVVTKSRITATPIRKMLIHYGIELRPKGRISNKRLRNSNG